MVSSRQSQAKMALRRHYQPAFVVARLSHARHCFLFASWRGDFRLATLRHLHTSLFPTDVSYCKDVENEVLVVRHFFK